jgi:hypothetical protein
MALHVTQRQDTFKRRASPSFWPQWVSLHVKPKASKSLPIIVAPQCLSHHRTSRRLSANLVHSSGEMSEAPSFAERRQVSLRLDVLPGESREEKGARRCSKSRISLRTDRVVTPPWAFPRMGELGAGQW